MVCRLFFCFFFFIFGFAIEKRYLTKVICLAKSNASQRTQFLFRTLYSIYFLFRFNFVYYFFWIWISIHENVHCVCSRFFFFFFLSLLLHCASFSMAFISYSCFNTMAICTTETRLHVNRVYRYRFRTFESFHWIESLLVLHKSCWSVVRLLFKCLQCAFVFDHWRKLKKDTFINVCISSAY